MGADIQVKVLCACHLPAPHQTVETGTIPRPSLARQSAKKGERGLGELSGGFHEDRPVAAVGHHPKSGFRDRPVHLHAHFDGIEEIAVAIDDQGEAVMRDKTGGVKFMSS